MWAQFHFVIKPRLESWNEIFWKKAVGIAAFLWFLLGLWDLTKSELLPDEYQSWTVVKHTPHMSWRTWVIGILVILIVVLLEGANTAIRKRNAAIENLAEASQQQQTPQNVLRRDWNGDWKDLSNGFRDFTRHMGLRADWQHTSAGESWRICGEDSRTIHSVEVLCRTAGRLLVVSPRVSKSIPAEITAVSDPLERWLYYLKGKGSFYRNTTIATEQFEDGTTFNAYGGSIQELARASANECLDCAGQEF
jgi:hypothetical protein